MTLDRDVLAFVTGGDMFSFLSAVSAGTDALVGGVKTVLDAPSRFRDGFDLARDQSLSARVREGNYDFFHPGSGRARAAKELRRGNAK